MKRIMLYIFVFLLSLNIALASGTITRTVSNTNPSPGEQVTVTLTAIMTDMDGSENEWFVIREPVPSWSYNKADFGVEASVISVVELDLSGGTYAYTYTVTAPSTDSTLSFAGGKYQIGEGISAGDFTTTLGTNKLDVGAGGPVSNGGTTGGTTGGTNGGTTGGSGLGGMTWIFVVIGAFVLYAIVKKR